MSFTRRANFGEEHFLGFSLPCVLFIVQSYVCYDYCLLRLWHLEQVYLLQERHLHGRSHIDPLSHSTAVCGPRRTLCVITHVEHNCCSMPSWTDTVTRVIISSVSCTAHCIHTIWSCCCDLWPHTFELSLLPHKSFVNSGYSKLLKSMRFTTMGCSVTDCS